MAEKRFSRFLTYTLFGFSAVSLALILGTLSRFLWTSLQQEFAGKIAADQAEVSLILRDHFSRLETRITELSLDTTLRAQLIMGVTGLIEETLAAHQENMEGVTLLIHADADGVFIPDPPDRFSAIRSDLEGLTEENSLKTLTFVEDGTGGPLSFLVAPVSRKSERLGTLFAVSDLTRAEVFWRRLKSRVSGRLLHRIGHTFTDLETGRRFPATAGDPVRPAISGPDRSSEESLHPVSGFDGLFYSVSTAPFQERRKVLLNRLAVLCFLVFAMSLAAAYYMVRKLSQPIENLARQAKTISETSSGGYLEASGLRYAEFKILAGAFNQMLESLMSARQKEADAKNFLNAILNTVADPVFVKDADHRFLLVNDALCDFLGADRKTVQGKTSESFFPPEQAGLFHKEDDMARKNASSGITQIGLWDKSGNERIVSIKKRCFRQTEIDTDFIVGVMRDITDFIRLENELSRHRDHLAVLVEERTAELSRTNEQLLKEIDDRKKAEADRNILEGQLQRAQKMEAIGMLAGGVAHDLNNILSGIVSYPELLLMELSEDSRLRNPILTMKKSGERAAAIVQDLLTLARRGVTVSEVVNLNEIITEYLQSPEYQNLCAAYPVMRAETDLDSGAAGVFGSRVHLMKTVMNLIQNAAEAMPEGGEIRIRTRNRYVEGKTRGYDAMADGDYVELSVSDTGAGIHPADLERIFEPFYTKKVMGRSGTGLGLAVVWGTVKDHHGHIDVQSVPGEGAVFTLYFPVSKQDAGLQHPIPPMESLSGSGEFLLVVDDMAEQREIAIRMLTRLGYAAEAVESGEAAVAFIRERAVDLVVLDMMMEPGMDGLTTFQRMIDLCPGQKAVIASGFAETERIRMAQKMGVSGHVKKPYSLQTLAVAVRNALNGKHLKEGV